MTYLGRADEKIGTNVLDSIRQGKWSQGKAGHLIRSIEQAAHPGDYIRTEGDLSALHGAKRSSYTNLNTISQLRGIKDLENSQDPLAVQLRQKIQEINDRQPKKFRYAPKPGDYVDIPHPAFQDWHHMGTNPDGTPVLASSPVWVRKDLAPYITNRLGLDKSSLRSDEGLGKISGPLLEAGAQAKSVLLSGSPFHVIQEMLRGLMLGINPLVRPNPVADFGNSYNSVRGEKPLMHLAAKNGMTMTSKYYGQEFSEGLASHSGLVSKIPVLGPISDEMHSFLFDRYIPALKISGFRKMFDKYAQIHSDWTDDAVAHAAAEHVNNAFGGQNWREMGRSATTQDWFHILALAL